MDQQLELLENLRTVRDFIRWGTSRFNEEELWFGHGTDNAWDEAVVLVMHGLHLPVNADPQVLDAALTGLEKERVLQLLERRITERLPAPYITGEAWFCGMNFHVDPRVLIPRSPIAELIENRFEPWLPREPRAILDLCTGSGCIGIACARTFPDARVDISDISKEALAVAEENIALHHMEDSVTAIESDLFSGLAGRRYDLIVSNPPYVDALDYKSMPPEYQHEPAMALASGGDGLEFTRRLLSQAANHLNDKGVLIVEVGNSWTALEEAYPQLPLTWLEFNRGGHGVFLLTAEQLQAGHLKSSG